jgi:acetolactate synthase-1/2/3 large subunit
VRAADALVDGLIAGGVELVFGLPGGAISPMYDAFLDHPEVRVVTTRHEAGAIFAAAGYCRATNKPCVVMVTSGPGILNALTGLASAHYDHLPILVLVGEVPRGRFGKGALQEGSPYGDLDIVKMTAGITRFAAECTDANQAPALLERAIQAATSGAQGPALLTLPIDVATTRIRPPRLARASRFELVADTELTGAAADALEHARRPLLFVGSGARWGDGPRRVLALAERLQAPVMTTPKAKGLFPDDHPLCLGVFGLGSHPSTSDYLNGGVDVLLAIGSSLGEAATSGWSPLLSPTEHFIQVDIDPRQLGRSYPITMGLHGDASRVLGGLLAQLGPGLRPLRSFGIRRFDDATLVANGAQGRISPQRALWELQEIMPRDTLYSLDIGEHMLFGIHHLRINEPNSFILSLGFGSMGSGIGAGLGIKLARPDRPVVAVCGDGCFSMALCDLATAVRERVPFAVVVLNDQRFGMVEIGCQAIYSRTASFGAGPLDIPQLARGVGARSLVVERAGDLLLLDLVDHMEHGPVVVDVRIDRDVRMPKNARFDFLKEQVGPRVAR